MYAGGDGGTVRFGDVVGRSFADGVQQVGGHAGGDPGQHNGWDD